MAFLLVLVSGGCHGSANPSGIVCKDCEEDTRFVQLQPHAIRQASGDSLALSHPFRFSPEDWRVILASVRVQRRPEGFLEPVGRNPVVEAFTAGEVNYLARGLNRAFSIAQPHEWVVFSLTRPISPSILEYTTGAWYVEGRNLHLVLANYRSAVSLPGIRALLRQNPLHGNGQSVYDVVPGRHQSMVEQDGAHAFLFESTDQKLAIDYRSAVADGSPPAQSLPEADAFGRARTAPFSETPAATGPIEERLQTLKRLLDQGLITEEDYRVKKLQLLDRL
jgi:hypothetical protein